MNIILAFTHTRRAVTPLAFKRAFKTLGHKVISIGPFDDRSPFGVRECLPDVPLPERAPPHYDWSEELMPPQFGKPDLLIVMAAGDELRVTGAPCPLVHWSLDGSDLAWSDTPHKYSMTPADGAAWLPPAFEYHAPRQSWPNVRAYDFVNLATATPERMGLWQDVIVGAPDLHCVFGDIWGPLYASSYQHALATWTDTDAVSPRTLEAMAMGCVIIGKRSESMAAMFREGDHFIAYEGAPDAAQLIAGARTLRKRGDQGMAKRAYAFVTEGQHSYIHRARRIVMEVRSK